jgi:hypothetical protein
MNALSDAATRVQDGEPARQVVRVFRLVLIKDGEFVRPAQPEPVPQATAC